MSKRRRNHLVPLLEWWHEQFGDTWVQLTAVTKMASRSERGRHVCAVVSGLAPDKSRQCIGQSLSHLRRSGGVLSGFRVDMIRPENGVADWRVSKDNGARSAAPEATAAPSADVDDRFLSALSEAMRRRVITGVQADAIMEIWTGDASA